MSWRRSTAASGKAATAKVRTSRIEQLEAELAAEQQRSAGHRADFERERERADQLVTGQDKLVTQLKNLRLLLQVARQDAESVAQRTLREWWS
jgi:hypothetical protein